VTPGAAGEAPLLAALSVGATPERRRDRPPAQAGGRDGDDAHAAPGARPGDASAEPTRLVPSLIPAVEVTVEQTVARWLGLSARVARLDWPRLAVGAMQHRVEGICADALRALAWDELAPPTVVDLLQRRALLAEARFLAHYEALRELRDLDEELVASLVLLNGAALVGDYASPTHRMVGDVDLWVDAEHLDRLGERARRLGYWEKDGARGPTYYRDEPAGTPGAGYVGLDVYATPPLGAGDGPSGAHWAGNLVPHVVGDVKVHRPAPALELCHLLVRLHEHAGSWARWVAEDDVRLVRILDVELVAGGLGRAAATGDGPSGEAPGEAVLAHAEALGVVGEVAVGAAVVRGVRGALPPALAPLEPHARAAGPATRLLALPGGGLVTAGEPLVERALCVDKSLRTRALAAPPAGTAAAPGADREGRVVEGASEGAPAPGWSRGWRAGLAHDAAGLAAIAEHAARALTEAGLVGT
jgi:hypothetical protein